MMVLGTMRTLLIGITGGIVLFCSYGCVNLTGGPRARCGYVPTPRDAPFLGPEELGHHSYGFGVGEGSGMVYTLRGGSIDLDHLRGTADIARYAYQRCYSSIRNKGDGFSFGPSFEWYSNKVQFAYPDHWDRLNPAEKETMAQEIALQVGAMVGFHSTLWHEMLTWYGTHFLFIEPEFYSAFSWDDTYSNALGNKLAMEAVQNKSKNFNEAMTDLINREMQALGIVSGKQALEIAQSVKGTWYKPGLVTEVIRRNMDTGEDGYVSPAIIPGFTNDKPIDCPLSKLDALEKYGIGMTYTIRSAYGATGKLKEIAGTRGSIEPLKHFPAIMREIRREAREKYHFDIGE